MDERDFAPDKAAHEDIFAVADRPRHREDFLTFRMRPPASPDWPSSDDRSQGRHGPLRGLEDDAVLTDEGQCLA
jgi:hypothetical protein